MKTKQITQLWVITLATITALAFNMVPAYASYQTSLQAYWSFDNSVSPGLDSSGNSHGGTDNGVTWVTGSGLSKFGGALSFDGTNDYFIATGYKGVTGTASRTISLWFKTTSTTEQALIDWGAWSDYHNCMIGTHPAFGNEAYAQVFGGGYATFTDNAVNDGKWHNIVFILTSPRNMELWLDGTLQDSVIIDQDFNTGTTYDVNIGRYEYQNYGYFTGSMDDIAIWSRPLSAAEVGGIYNAGLQGESLGGLMQGEGEEGNLPEPATVVGLMIAGLGMIARKRSLRRLS